MRESLATETLKTGERLQIECVLVPDAERGEQILTYLSHKPPPYLAHLKAAIAGECDTLENRFYIGLLDGEMVGSIMTVEAHGVGIFGHVNTREDQRRKGICQAIMDHQMEHFRMRGGHALFLGTGFQSPAYWIYHSFGFRDLPGAHPGIMHYRREDDADFLAAFFAPGPARPVPARWGHWPLMSLLASLPELPYLRSLAFRAWGPTLLEGPYCTFRHQWQNHPDAAGAAVLETQTGAVSGVATVIPEGRWPGVSLLDLCSHPQTDPADIASLISTLPSPAGKTVCYTEPEDAVKIAALEQAGFAREAVLPDQLHHGDQWRDIFLYSRRG